MKYLAPLEEVRFLKRYRRFFADVELSTGEILTVHVPNTGSLKGLVEEPRPARISRSDSPQRKLKGTLEMLWSGSSWVGVNTQKPNALVSELLSSKKRKPWHPWCWHQAEVALNAKTRIDFVFCREELKRKLHREDFAEPALNPHHLVEVKNVTMASNDVAMFPDAPSERALKHIQELMAQKELGHSVEIVFVVQREDCTAFRPAKEVDPRYSVALREAFEKGLQVTPLRCSLSREELSLTPELLPIVW